MRKPSIFSRDYERQMRKRRKRIALMSIIGVIIVGAVIAKISLNNMDMENVKVKVQNWIDEGESNVDEEVSKIEDSQEQVEVKKEEVPVVTENKTMDLKIREDLIVKAEYEEVDGKIKFIGLKDAPSNIYYTLNPEKSLLLTIDENQNMKIFNVNKTEAVIGKDSYTAPNGEVFNKANVLSTYKDYLWNTEAKFIDNTTVAYISNVPYFGYDLDKYVWVANLNDLTHKTIWASKAKEVKLGKIQEKGLEVTINGNVKYITVNGDLVN
ncbi:MAG: hypothetical protein IJO26_04520 [Clostridium sp.]|nr:hypothetical protein [Clostridium sp.]